uniref:receptor-like protein EIX2 n=1 Tax=Erigeron canadensis TaxID=72917 RepID=UPI001CB90D0A|nr:receptor-like protein EIX2 [Erigeron canadensis]
MNSSLVFKGLSSNLVSLKISYCGVSSAALDSLHNLTSLRSLDMRANELTKRIPKSFVNLCNLRDIDFSFNDFSNISLNDLLGGLLDCESHIGRSSLLEELDISQTNISGTIPNFIGQLTSMKRLLLYGNRIFGSIPQWIGRLSSLEELHLSDNLLDGSLPHSLGNLSKLEELTFSNNLLIGFVSEAHFAKLASLIYLTGKGNDLTLLSKLVNWVPPVPVAGLGLKFLEFRASLSMVVAITNASNREFRYIRNTCISSSMPVSFWKSFPNLMILDMSHNRIQGALLDIPATIMILDLSFNEFSGELPKLSNGSFMWMLDLSSNFFLGSVQRILCSNSVEKYSDRIVINVLNLGNNHLSGIIPECWDKWQELWYLNLENNRLSSEIPGTMGSLRQLRSLSMRGNKLSGRLPVSLMNLESLVVL